MLTLQAGAGVHVAFEMAAELDASAAAPRLHELATLLRRRAAGNLPAPANGHKAESAHAAGIRNQVSQILPALLAS